MKRPSALAIAALAALLGCHSEPPEPPRIAFDSTSADVGSVAQGSEAGAEFAFANPGGTDLVIDSVSTACDCRTDAPTEVIGPGQRASIRFVCDTHGMAGLQTRTATVYSSDPANPVVPLTLRADVRARIVAEPQEVYVGKLRRGETSRRRLRLVDGDDAGVPVLQYRGRTLRLVSAIDPAAPEDEAANIRLDLTALPDAPLGRFRDEIAIATSDPAASLVVPVIGVVEGDLTLSPPRLVFGPSGSDARELLLHNTAGEAIDLPQVTRHPEWLAVEIEEAKAGFDYNIAARLKPPLPRGRLEGEIELSTSSAEQPMLTVPVVATGKSKD